MLSKANRLSLKTDRFRLEKEGVTYHSPLFTVITAPQRNKDLEVLRNPEYPRGTSRFAILVSKKLLPLSSDRHWLKRQLTEVLRLNLDKFPQGLDVFLIPKRNIKSATAQQILSDLIHTIHA